MTALGYITGRLAAAVLRAADPFIEGFLTGAFGPQDHLGDYTPTPAPSATLRAVA